ncbi:carboxypeptidase, partial [candidate division KSB1 bacterium]|nr:carboxypeptidase [candidate division KSB1 bacterium]
YVLVDMMKSVVNQGTARRVRGLGFDRPCAGKTGTTNDARDAWFIGFTPQLVTAVWVGFDHPKPLLDKNGNEITSGPAATPIWTYFMKDALKNERYLDFTIPAGIIFEYVDPKTGEIVPQYYENAQQVALKAGTQLPVKDLASF